jgi:hypothetical protein
MFDNHHSRTNLTGSVKRYKGEKEEIQAQLEKNGYYKKSKKKVERADDSELDWNSFLKCF